MTDKDLWIAVRQALLLVVDAIERRYSLPRTSDLRREIRQISDANTLDKTTNPL